MGQVCNFTAKPLFKYIVLSLVPRPSHTASDQKLDGGKAWEWAYIVLTFTDRCLSHPLTTSETLPHVFTDQWEPSVAGVSGLGANCGPSDAHLAIFGVGKISAVYNCSKESSLIPTCFQAPSQFLLHNNMSQSSQGAWERGYLCVHMILCKNTIIQVFGD